MKYTTPCHKAYSEGLNRRKECPLDSGAYKLRDAGWRLKRQAKEILILSRCLKQREPLRGLCTYGDHAPWLKNLPLTIADILGYYVLPAIKKLDSDNVPVPLIQQRLPYFKNEIAQLLFECELAFIELKRGVRYEYKLWKNNDSVLMPLVMRTQDLIDSALKMVPPSPRQTVQSTTSQESVHGV
jgi:hypothetical protein